MSILFSIYVVVFTLLNGISFSSLPAAEQFMVWRCILTSLVCGFLAEWSIARWRFDGPDTRRWRNSLTYVVTNWLAALGVGAIALAALALPVFDSMRVVGLIASVIVIEFVAVCSVASVITSRRRGPPLARAVFVRGFGNYALMNVVSMIVGVAAGRLYLNLFYPGVG